jgi:hypothetical protein
MVGADGRAVFVAHGLSPSVDEHLNFGFVVHEPYVNRAAGITRLRLQTLE